MRRINFFIIFSISSAVSAGQKQSTEHMPDSTRPIQPASSSFGTDTSWSRQPHLDFMDRDKDKRHIGWAALNREAGSSALGRSGTDSSSSGGASWQSTSESGASGWGSSNSASLGQGNFGGHKPAPLSWGASNDASHTGMRDCCQASFAYTKSAWQSAFKESEKRGFEDPWATSALTDDLEKDRGHKSSEFLWKKDRSDMDVREKSREQRKYLMAKDVWKYRETDI